MKRYLSLIMSVLFVGILTVACVMPQTAMQPTPETSHGGPIDDYVSLVDALRKAGATVEPAGEIEQPFFSVHGQVIEVNGERVQVFEYPDLGARRAESDAISAGGSAIGGTMVSWVEAPHFWIMGRIIVLYVGQDNGVLDLLTDTLGPQFAGQLARSGGSDMPKPPAAKLEIDRRVQFSGIGSYCWSQPGGPGVCADAIGIPTAREPLPARTLLTAKFELAVEQAPEELVLNVVPVSAEDEMDMGPRGLRMWQPQPGERYELPLEREPAIELRLEPGLYVLNLFGRWQNLGDASYGFLIEVEP